MRLFRSWLIILLSVFICTFTTVRAAHASSGAPVYTAIVQHSSMCLDFGTSGNVFQATCNGGLNQNWTIAPRPWGTDNRQIKNKDGLCLVDAGTGVKLSSCTTTGTQTWAQIKSASGYSQFRNVSTGRCLTVGGSSQESGAAIYPESCVSGKPSQSWAQTLIISGESNQTYSNYTLSNPKGPCVKIQNSSSNITLANSQIAGCAGDGIVAQGVKSVKILNSNAAKVNTPGATCTHPKVEGNRVNWTNKNGVSNGFYQNGTCTPLTLSSNAFYDTAITESALNQVFSDPSKPSECAAQ